MENSVQKIQIDEQVHDVAVIGLGPSGVAACIELVKRGIKPIAYEPGLIGGQINFTAEINNYPSFSGPAYELTARLTTTVKDLGIQVKRQFVKKVSMAEDGLFIMDTAKDQMLYKCVIVATGTRYRPYGIPEVPLNPKNGVKGRGFSRCAICDGPLYKGKDVMVIGGGEAAFQEGLYLSSICKSVTLINRRTIFRAAIKDVEAFKNRPNTKIIAPAVTVSCSGEGHLQHVVIKDPNDTEDKTLQTLDVTGCFIYIGADPVTNFIDLPEAKNANGTMKVDEDMKVIAVPGLLACGDVIDTPLRQVATAVGFGSKAGISASRFIMNRGW